MIVRLLTSEDLQEWRSIRLEALRNEPDAFLTTAAEEEARPVADALAYLAKGGVFGVWDGDALAGVMALTPETRAATQHRAWLHAVYVRPAWRGTPAAGLLLDHVVDEARARDIAQLELYVASSNDRAIGFYQRRGFVPCGRVPRAVRRDGQDIDDLHMWRPLDADEG